ncbi:MAG: hypothetical protein HY717_07020 [Planctomycetes bacterium]|nr:hypothetical protein [Planctomycetota bacterium]
MVTMANQEEIQKLVERAKSGDRDAFGDTESLGLPPRSFDSERRSHGQR